MEGIQIVILAGGLGTRLRPLTDQMPKAMIPIHGKPFVHYQLKWLAQSGVTDVILSTGYLGYQIHDYVKDGSAWGLKVQFVDEGKNLRGTGGAIRYIYDHDLLADKFLVTYGDSFLPIDFQNVWDDFNQRAQPALMTVLRNGEKWDASNVCFDGKLVTLYDKKIQPKPPEMHYIDYGVSAFRKEIIAARIPKEEKYDLATLFRELSVEGLLSGQEVKERFYEIGSMQGIDDLEKYLKEPKNSAYHWL
jgi:MurNAc alpha-1-phosphate uridylyltransferase